MSSYWPGTAAVAVAVAEPMLSLSLTSRKPAPAKAITPSTMKKTISLRAGADRVSGH